MFCFTYNGTLPALRVACHVRHPRDRKGLTVRCDVCRLRWTLPWGIRLDVSNTFSCRKFWAAKRRTALLSPVAPALLRGLESYHPAWPLAQIFA